MQQHWSLHPRHSAEWMLSVPAGLLWLLYEDAVVTVTTSGSHKSLLISRVDHRASRTLRENDEKKKKKKKNKRKKSKLHANEHEQSRIYVQRIVSEMNPQPSPPSK